MYGHVTTQMPFNKQKLQKLIKTKHLVKLHDNIFKATVEKLELVILAKMASDPGLNTLELLLRSLKLKTVFNLGDENLSYGDFNLQNLSREKFAGKFLIKTFGIIKIKLMYK